MEPEVLETDNTNEQPVENTIDPQTLPVEDLIHYEEELNELQNLSKTANNLSDIIQEGNEVGEEVYEKIEEAKKTLEEKADEIDPLDTVIAQESLRIYRKRLGMEELPASFNLEDATSNPTLAMTMNIEGLKEIGNTILGGIMKAWAKLVDFLKAIFKKFKSVIAIKEKGLSKLKQQLNDPKNEVKEKIRETLKDMHVIDVKNFKLNRISDSIDEPEKRPLYKTLKDLHAFDLLGREEYPMVLKSIVATLPSALSGMVKLIKEDLTEPELGRYLMDVFKKSSDAIGSLPYYKNVLQSACAEAIASHNLGIKNACSVIPVGENEFHVIIVGKMDNTDTYLYANTNRVTIEDDVNINIDPDTLAKDTIRALDILDGETLLRTYDSCLKTVDGITRNANILISKGLASEQSRAIKNAIHASTQILNTIRYALEVYNKLYTRAKALNGL